MEVIVTDITTQVEVDAGYELFEVVIIASDGTGGVQSVTGTAVDNTDPLNPIVNLPTTGGLVDSVTGDGVDNTDPFNPVLTFPTTGQLTEDSNDRFVTDADLVKLANTSGTNTGDQDISGIAINSGAIDAIELEQITQNEAIALNTAKRSYPIEDETRLANTSGVNTGDETTLSIQTKRPLKTVNGESLEGAGDIVVGGAVDSVNGQTGIVLLDADDIDDSLTINKYVTASDLVKLSDTSGVNTGDQDLTPYLTIVDASSTYEPIKGIDDNYVTDAQLVVIANTSGINTGDQDISGIATNASAISDINLLLPQFTTVERENNTCLFDKNYIIGNTTPRSGNILFDFTGAELGATTFMFHDNVGAYTFPAQGVVYDFKIADLAGLVGTVLFAFTLTKSILGSEIVQIRLSYTEAQMP